MRGAVRVGAFFGSIVGTFALAEWAAQIPWLGFVLFVILSVVFVSVVNVLIGEGFKWISKR